MLASLFIFSFALLNIYSNKRHVASAFNTTQPRQHTTNHHCRRLLTLGVVNIAEVAVSTRRALAVFLVLLLLPYQFLLSTMGLQEYVESSERLGWFSSNREGVLGCLGYCAIFFIAEEIGRKCFWIGPSKSPKSGGCGSEFNWALAAITAAGWLLWFLMELSGMQVSRRSTNLLFVIWSVTFNCSLLLAMSAVCRDGRFAKAFPLLTFGAINRNGLAVFLISNILTGVVNLSFDTLNMPDHKAVAIVFLYMTTVVLAALKLDGVILSSSQSPSEGKQKIA